MDKKLVAIIILIALLSSAVTLLVVRDGGILPFAKNVFGIISD